MENPYAPPQSELYEDKGERVWQQGRYLVFDRDVALPHRCYICNQATNQRLQYKVTWTHPMVIVMFFVMLFGMGVFADLLHHATLNSDVQAIVFILYLIVMLSLIFIKRRFKVSIGICEQHYQKRRNLTITAWLGFITSIVLFFLATYGQSFELLMLALGIFLGTLGVAIWASQFNIRARKIEPRLICLTGIKKSYLNSLSPMP